MDLAVKILLLILIAAFVWVGVELALTFRKVRRRTDDLMQNLDSTIKRIDTTVEALQPAVAQIEPLVHKTETTVDALSLDLLHVNEILGDVKSISGAAAGATTAVTGVVDKAAGAVSNAVSRIGPKGGKAKGASRLSAAQISNALVHAAQGSEHTADNAEGPDSARGHHVKGASNAAADGTFEVDIDDIDDDMVTLDGDDIEAATATAAPSSFDSAAVTSFTNTGAGAARAGSNNDYFVAPVDATTGATIWDDLEIEDLEEPASVGDSAHSSGWSSEEEGDFFNGFSTGYIEIPDKKPKHVLTRRSLRKVRANASKTAKTKKAAPKKVPAVKKSASKPAAKKTSAKVVAKTTATKAATKKTATKAATKRSTTKAATKKTATKKPTTTKRTATKAATKKTAAKKPAAAKRTPAKKTAAKKTPAKAATKTSAKKAAPKKTTRRTAR